MPFAVQCVCARVRIAHQLCLRRAHSLVAFIAARSHDDTQAFLHHWLRVRCAQKHAGGNDSGHRTPDDIQAGADDGSGPRP